MGKDDWKGSRSTCLFVCGVMSQVGGGAPHMPPVPTTHVGAPAGAPGSTLSLLNHTAVICMYAHLRQTQHQTRQLASFAKVVQFWLLLH